MGASNGIAGNSGVEGSIADEGDLDRDQRIALAVARLIAIVRSGGDVKVLSVPEKEDRTNPAVELVTMDTAGVLAIEHTQIEPFDGQIRDDHQIAPYAEALTEMLADVLPVGSRFDLNLEVGATNGVRSSQQRLAKIVRWVDELAPTLEDGRPGIDGRHMAKAGPPDLPFSVTLTRWPQPENGSIPQVSIGRWRPTDIEERRCDRLVVAFRHKVPKLAEAADMWSGKAVLVIESADEMLSNAVDITLAVHAAAAEVERPLPAWVVLWEQFGDSASAWLLRAADEWAEEPYPSALPPVPRGS